MTPLCWFCGRKSAFTERGLSVGEIAYSSNIHVSSALAGDESAVLQPWHIATLEDGCVMCRECIRNRSRSIGELSTEYVQCHLANEKDQRDEIADTDTHLLSWRDKRYPFGCWLCGFPDIGVRQKFWSLTMGELFLLGFRLHGRISLGAWEAGLLLEKFIQNDAPAVAPKGFADHVQKMIQVECPTFANEFAKLRAVVFDISVYMCANGISSHTPVT